MPYEVIFRTLDGISKGAMTRTTYRDRQHFVQSYNDRLRSMYDVVEEDVTDERARQILESPEAIQNTINILRRKEADLRERAAELSMPTPWLADFESRNWTVVKMPIGQYRGFLKPLLRDCDDLQVIAAESPQASELWDKGVRTGIFFTDAEQVFGMGMSGDVGGDVRYLMDEFEGHSTGSLVYILYEGIEDGYYTIGFAE